MDRRIAGVMPIFWEDEREKSLRQLSPLIERALPRGVSGRFRSSEPTAGANLTGQKPPGHSEEIHSSLVVAGLFWFLLRSTRCDDDDDDDDANNVWKFAKIVASLVGLKSYNFFAFKARRWASNLNRSSSSSFFFFFLPQNPSNSILIRDESLSSDAFLIAW